MTPVTERHLSEAYAYWHGLFMSYGMEKGPTPGWEKGVEKLNAQRFDHPWVKQRAEEIAMEAERLSIMFDYVGGFNGMAALKKAETNVLSVLNKQRKQA